MSRNAHQLSRAVPEQSRPAKQAVEEKLLAFGRILLKKPLTWALVGLSVLIIAIYLIFLLPVYGALACDGGVWVGVEYPRTLSTGDEGHLRLTIQNRAASPLTGTLSLHFLGPLPVQLREGQVTRLEIENLPGGGSAGFAISFWIHAPICFFCAGTVDFSLRWTTANGTALCRSLEGTEALRIPLAPVHGLRGLFHWLRSIPLSLVALTLWEWMKERVLKP